METTKNGVRYGSRWDGSTWLILGLVVASWIACYLLDDEDMWPSVICLVMLAFVVVVLLSIYYRIDGDKLIVYTFFRPKAYPIDKIQEIKHTDSILSAPATSLTHRLAITFTDRNVLKSFMPLIISPVNQDEFIKQLLEINPGIRYNSSVNESH